MQAREARHLADRKQRAIHMVSDASNAVAAASNTKTHTYSTAPTIEPMIKNGAKVAI